MRELSCAKRKAPAQRRPSLRGRVSSNAERERDVSRESEIKRKSERGQVWMERESCRQDVSLLEAVVSRSSQELPPSFARICQTCSLFFSVNLHCCHSVCVRVCESAVRQASLARKYNPVEYHHDSAYNIGCHEEQEADPIEHSLGGFARIGA